MIGPEPDRCLVLTSVVITCNNAQGGGAPGRDSDPEIPFLEIVTNTYYFNSTDLDIDTKHPSPVLQKLGDSVTVHSHASRPIFRPRRRHELSHLPEPGESQGAGFRRISPPRRCAKAQTIFLKRLSLAAHQFYGGKMRSCPRPASTASAGSGSGTPPACRPSPPPSARTTCSPTTCPTAATWWRSSRTPPGCSGDGDCTPQRRPGRHGGQGLPHVLPGRRGRHRALHQLPHRTRLAQGRLRLPEHGPARARRPEDHRLRAHGDALLRRGEPGGHLPAQLLQGAGRASRTAASRCGTTTPRAPPA